MQSIIETIDENSSFGVWAELWKRKKMTGMKYTYRNSIKGHLNHLRPIYEIPINKVRAMHIEQIILDLAENNPHTNRPSSKKLLINIRLTAISIFNYAIANCDNLYKNCALAVEIPSNAPKNKRRALNSVEQNLVLNTMHKARVPALIMMLCGLRIGEMIALTWDNVDLDNGIIHVCQSVFNINSNTYEIQNKTKNGRTRNVSIPRQLVEILRAHRKTTRSQYVTTAQDGLSMHSRKTWFNLWRSYTKAIGIKITTHQLRHTYASLLYAAGVDVKSASELLGHSDIEITLRIYTHLTEQGKKISIDKYEIFIDKNLPFNESISDFT